MKDSLIRLVLWSAIMSLVVYFGFFAPHGAEFSFNPNYPDVKVYNVDDFYWRLHPFKFWDGLGMFLLASGLWVITGAYKLVIGEQGATKGEAGAIYAAAAAAAGLGILLFYA